MEPPQAAVAGMLSGGIQPGYVVEEEKRRERAIGRLVQPRPCRVDALCDGERDRGEEQQPRHRLVRVWVWVRVWTRVWIGVGVCC